MCGSQPATMAASIQRPMRLPPTAPDEQHRRQHADADSQHHVPLRPQPGKPQLLSQPVPAHGPAVGRRLVVNRRQQNHVADLGRVEFLDRQRLVTGGRMPGLPHLENAIDQLRHRQRQDSVDVVPQPPLGQRPVDPPASVRGTAHGSGPGRD